ncbi:MAG: FAD-binding oxidoreductase [Pseudomonadota bacterium]
MITRRTLSTLIGSALTTGLSTHSFAQNTWIKSRDDASDILRGYQSEYLRVPKIYAAPKTEMELTQALDFIRAKNRQFAFQSSGHCFAGFSQSKDVLIDMRGFNRIEIKDDLITFGPGVRVQDLNRALTPLGLILPLGTCPTVAMGGYVSAGGVGAWSRALGLASDAVISFRIALSDGRIVNASETSNADLYWALRGGVASGFGALISITSRAVPFSEARLLTFLASGNAKDMGRWLAGLETLLTSADQRLDLAFGLASHSDDSFVITLDLTSLADFETTRDFAVEIFNLGHMVGDPKIVEGDLSTIAPALHPAGYETTRRIHNSIYTQRRLNAQEWESFLHEMGQAHRAVAPLVLYRALGGAVEEGQSGAYAHRAAKALISISARPKVNSEAKSAYPSLHRLRNKLVEFGATGMYPAYPDRYFENWATENWGSNYARLQKVKAKYDPTDFFHTPQSVRLPA